MYFSTKVLITSLWLCVVTGCRGQVNVAQMLRERPSHHGPRKQQESWPVSMLIELITRVTATCALNWRSEVPAARAVKHLFHFLQRAAHPLLWILPIFLELSTKRKGLQRSSQVLISDRLTGDRSCGCIWWHWPHSSCHRSRKVLFVIKNNILNQFKVAWLIPNHMSRDSDLRAVGCVVLFLLCSVELLLEIGHIF